MNGGGKQAASGCKGESGRGGLQSRQHRCSALPVMSDDHRDRASRGICGGLHVDLRWRNIGNRRKFAVDRDGDRIGRQGKQAEIVTDELVRAPGPGRGREVRAENAEPRTGDDSWLECRAVDDGILGRERRTNQGCLRNWRPGLAN